MLFEMRQVDQFEDRGGAIRVLRTGRAGNVRKRLCYADVCDESLTVPGDWLCCQPGCRS
jgi:hypothetical protein